MTSCGLEQAHEDRTIACAESKEPATDALITILKENQYPIACYYYNPKSPDYGQGLLKKAEWEWARVPNYDPLIGKSSRAPIQHGRACGR